MEDCISLFLRWFIVIHFFSKIFYSQMDLSARNACRQLSCVFHLTKYSILHFKAVFDFWGCKMWTLKIIYSCFHLCLRLCKSDCSCIVLWIKIATEIIFQELGYYLKALNFSLFFFSVFFFYWRVALYQSLAWLLRRALLVLMKDKEVTDTGRVLAPSYQVGQVRQRDGQDNQCQLVFCGWWDEDELPHTGDTDHRIEPQPTSY